MALIVNTCAYCPNVAVRTEPFSGKPCCDECFNLLIGGEANDPPFRCGNETPVPDRSTWTEADLLDAATYGRCRCGQPFRARIDRDEEGRPTRMYAACDDGHEMGAEQPPNVATMDTAAGGTVSAAMWCVICGGPPEFAISYERREIMAHYGSCLNHVHQVADRALTDLGRIDAQDFRTIRTSPNQRRDVLEVEVRDDQ